MFLSGTSSISFGKNVETFFTEKKQTDRLFFISLI